MNDKKKIFVADVYSYNEVLDVSKIQTAGQFFVIANLTRALTQLNPQGNIVGNLVKSWTVKNDYKEYEFQISDDAKFSDGTKIHPSEIINSIKRQIKFNTANHFDFSAIELAEILNDQSFVVRLKKPNDNFLRHTSYPEFGILHSSDLQKSFGQGSFQTTSGPYTLQQKGDHFFLLKKNPFFPLADSKSPEEIKVQFSDVKTKVTGLIEKIIDISLSVSPIPNDLFLKIKNSNSIHITKPHLGYSFWISINPKSENCKSLTVRRQFQKILNFNKYNFINLQPFWEPAKQLYLPDGMGRLTDAETESFWKKNESVKIEGLEKKQFSFLIAEDFPFKNEIKNILDKTRIEYEFSEYKTIGELLDLKAKKDFDFFQIRNDFSSVDLNENLQTTFNPSNPLIETTEVENFYKANLEKAIASNSETTKHEIYRNIASDLLEKAFIIPIAYYHVLYFHQKNVDISKWSLNIPEVSFWKIRVD